MSDRDLERGPKGDHGQHGDTGDVGRQGGIGRQGERGDTGYAGAPGLAGLPGERGERGPLGDRGYEGLAGPRGLPGQDYRSNIWPKLRLLAFILLTVASLYSSARTFGLAQANKVALHRIDAQRVDSRNQICLSDEREHLEKVNQLKRTYDYIVRLKPSEYTQTINAAVILQLPQTEKTGRTDNAPDFCDVTRHVKGKDGKIHDVDVGLPEPDPKVPKRPAKVDRAFRAVIKATS